MQTFPNTKYVTLCMKTVLPENENSLPCAAARSGTQSFKNQAAKKRRAHTMYVCPKFSAHHSKTNAAATWEKDYPVYSLEQV